MRFYLALAAGILTLALLSQWVKLPLAYQGIWMSPDETANSLSAVALAETGSFTIPNPITNTLPWIFPRSFVPLTGQSAMVLVGFLGMPLILAFAYKMIGIYGLLFFTPLFACLTLWPLWRSLPKEWSKGARWSSLLVWISFPTVIIYANRGTFSNLFITCLAVWLWWSITQVKKFWAWPLAGIILGLACVVRPTEAIWLIPLTVFAILYSRINIVTEKLKFISLAFLFLVTISMGAYMGYRTYGQWMVSGYQIRPDFSVISQPTADIETASPVSINNTSASILKTLPFGIHPKNIIRNAYYYLGWILWPWVLVSAGALFVVWREKIWKNIEKWAIAAFGWIAFTLIFFYGNGVYQDHVGFNVSSMGNSYLRYLLPMSVPVAVAAGLIVSRLWKYWSLKIMTILMVAGLVAVGHWSAMTRDDEGMQANLIELKRYAEIRDQARSMLAPQTVILSDRSDKIFFPFFNVASPTPNDENIKKIKEAGYDVALFMQTQKQEDEGKWNERGFKLRLLFTNGNQSLYHLE